ncbi:hypothetical protein pipiens_000372, partial [Culex pipiens pipiens]
SQAEVIRVFGSLILPTASTFQVELALVPIVAFAESE